MDKISVPFDLQSEYKPGGDQPEAIRQLVEGIERGDRYQTLLGATGTGKTFTVSNVIQEVKKPTLVLAHNKTLAGQLYSEFKEFFPNNAVEYFVSYYDYYQPEAYVPSTDTFIEKTPRLTMRSINSVTRRHRPCSSATTSSSSLPSPVFTVSVTRKNITVSS